MLDARVQPTHGTAATQAGGPSEDALRDRLIDTLGAPPSDRSVRRTADEAVAGASSRLPFLDRVQSSFGRFDISGVRAATDERAATGTAALGADGLATGDRVALGPDADLHTVAHEAAHVVQQQAGVHLASATGRPGDPYERHADAVADRVVQGRSAEDLLSREAGPPSATAPASGPVQLSRGKESPTLTQGMLLVWSKIKGVLSDLNAKSKPTREDPKLLWEDEDRIKKMGKPEMKELAAETPLWGKKGPQLEDIQQGYIGDCFLLAAAGAVLRKNPKIIRSMFIDQGSAVTVRLFHEGSPKLIKVAKSVPKLNSENERTDAYAGGALWVQLLEKAMACLNYDEGGDYKDIAGGTTLAALKALTGDSEELSTELTDEKDEKVEEITPWPKGSIDRSNKKFKSKRYIESKDKLYDEILGSDDAKEWSSLMDTFETADEIRKSGSLPRLEKTLTDWENKGKIGSTTAKKVIKYAKENKLFPSHTGSDWYTKEDLSLFERLHDALSKGKGVTASTKGQLQGDNGGDGLSGEAKVGGLVTGHAYTVLGVSERKDRRWVTVRNPWGKYGREYKTDDEGNFLQRDGELLPKAVEEGDGVSEIELTDFAMSFDKISTC